MNNKKNTRKTILLTLIVILSAIYVLQVTFSSRNSIKELVVQQEIDGITLESVESGKLELIKENDEYVLGDKKFKTEQNVVTRIENQIKNIKILDVVAPSLTEATESRYGLDPKNRIVVTATSGGKTVRTLIVGKTSTTGEQTYMQIDGKKEVCLVSGSLAAAFSSTESQIRDKNIYSFESASIEQVEMISGNDSFKIVKIPATSGSADKSLWALMTDNGIDFSSNLDNEKVLQWITALSNMRASDWADERTVVSEEDFSIKLKVKGKSVEIKAKKADEDKYLCSCTETKYPFYLSSYLGNNITKTILNLQ